MKIPAVVILIFVVSQVCSAAGPFGEFVELHSCDLYTGGCTASAESTLLGRQVFRVWSIESGEWNGQDLTHLKVAVLEKGSKNLAEKGALADTAEIFVPKGLAQAKRDALSSWAVAQHPLPPATPISHRWQSRAASSTSYPAKFAPEIPGCAPSGRASRNDCP